MSKHKDIDKLKQMLNTGLSTDELFQKCQTNEPITRQDLGIMHDYKVKGFYIEGEDMY